MKRASKNSIFRSGEFSKRYFTLSVNEGTFRYTDTENDAKKPGKGEFFKFTDILEIMADYSNGGKTIDFSGERDYPFPFTIRCI